jgi:hypothetical protein
MHDAVLVEIPKYCVTEATAALLDICRNVFADICPLVEPSVSEKDFFAE